MTKRDEISDPSDGLNAEWFKIVMAIGKRGEPTQSAIDMAFDEVGIDQNRCRLRATVDRAFYLDVPLFDINCQPLAMDLVESECVIAHGDLMSKFPQDNLPCPKCKQLAGVPELIGYPSMAASAAAILGYVRFGGCVLRFGSSGNIFVCKECRHRWRTDKPVDFSVIQYLSDQFEVRERLARQTLVTFDEQDSIGVCPACGGKVYESEVGYYCGNSQGIGRTCWFRVGRVVLGRTIPRNEIDNLLRQGKTSHMDGFVANRTKRQFAARLVVDDGKIGFQFDPIEARLSEATSRLKPADDLIRRSSVRVENIEAWKTVVSGLERLKSFKAPENLRSELKRKGYLEVEVPDFLSATPHLSLKGGYRLRGIVHARGRNLGQFAYMEIFAFPNDCAPKTADQLVRHRKKIIKEWSNNGRSTELNIYSGTDCVGDWLRLVKCDGTEHSFFELVALGIYESNYCGSGYRTRKLLLEPLRTQQDLLRLHANAFMDKKFVDAAMAANSSIDFSPTVVINELDCRVTYIEFESTTGFERVTVRVRKSAPHQIVEEERVLLVEYDSGFRMD